MKLGKLEVKKHNKYPVVAVKYDGKPVFYMEKTSKPTKEIIQENKSKKPCIKKRCAVKIVSVALVLTLLGGGVALLTDNNSRDDVSITISDTKTKNNYIDFKTMDYGNKTYLTLDEEDLLVLIEKAMKEVDKEYVANGNKTVFDVEDTQYSQFTKHDILGLMFTESSFRLLEIKDENKSIFSVDNYARFFGKDKAGIIYYGPGMMNKETVEYIVSQDRQVVNNFENYSSFKINGKQVEISYENLNPYDYVLNSGAKTKKEIEQALKECISLNVKCIYTYLNRLVKDNVKAGTHDAELNKLESYSELKSLTTEEKQKVFALIGYNNGPTKTRNAMLNGTLFNKYLEGEHAGEYIINVKYANKVLIYATDSAQENVISNEIN